jgi:hypothetical protein
MARQSRGTRVGRRQASRAADAAQKLPVNSVLPAISGTVRQGFTLTCTSGTWSNTPDSYAYQWRRDGSEIIGANASTRVLALADVGALMTCAVVATNLGVPAVAISAPTAAVAAATAPANTVAPTITGTAQEGQTLTAHDGTWTGLPTPTITRQWKKNGVAIGGATGTTYVPVTGDIGAVITLTVTGTNVNSAVSATSAATSAVIAA